MAQPLRERLNENDVDNLKTELHLEAQFLPIRALIDVLGSESAIEELAPHYRNAGQAFAINMQNLFGLTGSSLERIRLISDLIEETAISPILRDTQILEQTDERIVKTTAQCPNRFGLEELCVLGHECFQKAICEQVDPDYTVTFTQMMTKGDPICCWVYEKKKK